MNKLLAGTRGYLISASQLIGATKSNSSLRILNTTCGRPLAEMDNDAVYRSERIPGSTFVDIDVVADKSIEKVSHQTPREKEWNLFMGNLDISKHDEIVLYDDNTVAGACKFWWNFYQYGKPCYVLDGGFNAWKAAGGDIEQGPISHTHRNLTPDEYRFSLDSSNFLNFEDVNACSFAIRHENADFEIVDARGGPRFRSEVPEPRAWLRSGNIPGSKNVFFKDLLLADGTFKSDDQIRAAFEKAGVDLNKNIVMSCGSSVTASVLSFALALIGHKKKRQIYGPSWSEFGMKPQLSDEEIQQNVLTKSQWYAKHQVK